ncbi:MAG: hypothetical protein WCA07_02815 [Gloeobacterales cyanobacterium]
MAQSQTITIPCSVSPGMFPNEYAVEVELDSHEKLSLFVQESDLEKIDLQKGTALLRVKLPENQANGKTVLLYLPEESLETGNRWIEFSSDRIPQLK